MSITFIGDILRENQSSSLWKMIGSFAGVAFFLFFLSKVWMKFSNCVFPPGLSTDTHTHTHARALSLPFCTCSDQDVEFAFLGQPTSVGISGPVHPRWQYGSGSFANATPAPPPVPAPARSTQDSFLLCKCDVLVCHLTAFDSSASLGSRERTLAGPTILSVREQWLSSS